MTTYAEVVREAKAAGLPQQTVWMRVKGGLSLDDALNVDDATSQASRRTKIPLRILVERTKSMSLEEAIEMGPENGRGPTVKALELRRASGDMSVRRSGARNKGVKEIAARTGLSKQRVSTLLTSGVQPEDIKRTLEKRESYVEYRSRVNRETALEHQRQADLCWLWCWLGLLSGEYKTTEPAKSYETTALWWSDR